MTINIYLQLISIILIIKKIRSLVRGTIRGSIAELTRCIGALVKNLVSICNIKFQKRQLIFITKLLSIVLLLITAQALSSCSKTNKDKLIPLAIKLPKKGDPIIVKAAHDGCYTSLFSRGKDFYRSFFKFSLDPKLINNSVYYSVFSRAYIYCFHWVGTSRWAQLDKFIGDSAYSYLYGSGTPKMDEMISLEPIYWPFAKKALPSPLDNPEGKWLNEMFQKPFQEKGIFH